MASRTMLLLTSPAQDVAGRRGWPRLLWLRPGRLVSYRLVPGEANRPLLFECILHVHGFLLMASVANIAHQQWVTRLD